MRVLKLFFSILLLIYCQSIFAGQYLGGRIEYDALGHFPADYTYQITIYTYTKTGSVQSDRPSLDSVYFGDGSPATVFVRFQRLDIANNITINIYKNTHTYSGSGTYMIHFSQLSLLGGIENLSASDTIPLFLQTTLVINSFLCNNSSPHLLTHPFFKTPFRKDLILARTAYSPNWDSLSYVLDTSHTPGFFIPSGVSLNNLNGEFKWSGDSMLSPGNYFFQLRIRAWKSGVNLSEVIEDFVILDTVMDSTYNFITTSFPPNFTSTISPNNQFNLHVEYYDSSSTPLMGFISEFFNPGLFTSTITNHIVTGDFTWTPSNQYIRNSPYVLQFRGKKDLAYTLFVDGPYIDTCHSLIGINDLNFESVNIVLFPNPSREEIQIHIDGINQNKIKAEMHDMSGKNVLEKYISKDDNVNVSNLSTGIYILRLEMDSRNFYRKVVVQDLF